MLNDDLFSYISKNNSKQVRIKGIRKYYKIINDICSQINTEYNSEDILKFLYSISRYICKDFNYYEYISMLISQKSRIGICEIIIWMFQAKMLCKNKLMSDNLTPVFIFNSYSRVDAAIRHKEIIELFENYIFYSSYRNPCSDMFLEVSSFKNLILIYFLLHIKPNQYAPTN